MKSLIEMATAAALVGAALVVDVAEPVVDGAVVVLEVVDVGAALDVVEDVEDGEAGAEVVGVAEVPHPVRAAATAAASRVERSAVRDMSTHH
ncbi:MAG: hypothetical protein ABIW80_00595, partial [Lapillicoccus sp.]